MSYAVLAYSPLGSLSDIRKVVDTIEDARDVAGEVVNERMEAFGEDREALAGYGYLDAEQQALDMPEDGGVIHLRDGWKIEVIRS